MSTFDIKRDSPKARISKLVENDALPQTVIIEGGENASRKELALHIAMSLVCDSENSTEFPCGNCMSCRKAKALRHPDIKIIEPDEGKATVSVDRMREVKADAYMSPFEANCKIYITEDSEKLSAAAQNAVLKLIEEPPSNVYFIFCCASSKQLLQTVRSRAICISAGKLASGDAVSYLKTVYPKANAEFLNKTAKLYGFCDEFNPAVLSEENLCTAYNICSEFFEGNGIDFSFFKKKSASTELCRLIFNMLAVGARDIYLYQLKKADKTKESESILLSDSVMEASKISIPRAMELYDAFSDAAVRLSEFANINSVTAKISAII